MNDERNTCDEAAPATPDLWPIPRGTPFRKTAGHKFGGDGLARVVACYETLSGERRVVGEHPEGWQFIFAPNQIETLPVDLPAAERNCIAEFNVNEYAMVKLNDEGMKILQDRHEEFRSRFPSYTGEWIPPKVDGDGFTKMQMWKIMETFGPHLYLGREPPFGGIVRLKVAK